MMKILLINWRDIKHPRAGGVEVRIAEVYRRIVEKGHEVTLFSSMFAGAASEEMVDGIRVIRAGNDMTFILHVLFQVPRIIKKYAISVVVEDFNKLPFLSPLFVRQKRLIQMHHLWKGSIFLESSLPVALFVWSTEQLIRFFYRNESFCVVSDSTCKELHSLGIPLRNISIIHNGVDLEGYIPQQEKLAIHATPYILWAGRLQKYKGVLDACKAFQKISTQFPEYELIIIGNGPFRKKLQRWVETRNLSGKIKLLGFVSHSDKVRYLQNAEVVLQTSYKEGWGLTVIEANACGVPVIGNNAPGLCDSIQDGQTGLLYDFGNIDALAEMLVRYLSDSQLQVTLRSNCRSWAEKFQWESAADETISLLLSL